jgi:hypothetical protein
VNVRCGKSASRDKHRGCNQHTTHRPNETELSHRWLERA